LTAETVSWHLSINMHASSLVGLDFFKGKICLTVDSKLKLLVLVSTE